jgi:hypothetical protein
LKVYFHHVLFGGSDVIATDGALANLFVASMRHEARELAVMLRVMTDVNLHVFERVYKHAMDVSI